MKGIGVGYNIQIAVDTKYKLIAELQVHNKVSDLGLLAETAVAASKALGVDKIDAVADRAATSKLRISKPARQQALYPTLPNRNAARPLPRASSSRTGSDMTPTLTPMPVPAAMR